MDPQNTNARFLDKFNSQKTTSVKIHHPPGGSSSFSLGWEEPKTNNNQKNQSKQFENTKFEDKPKSYNTGNNNYQYNRNNEENKDVKTSVKVANAPGGKSNFSFGNDKTSYEDYRK